MEVRTKYCIYTLNAMFIDTSLDFVNFYISTSKRYPVYNTVIIVPAYRVGCLYETVVVYSVSQRFTRKER